jgi:hypothetical protein
MKQLLLIFFCGLFFHLDASEPVVKTQEFPKEELQKQKEQIAAMVVKEIAKTLPQKIDTYTTLTSIKSDGSTLVYTFEINSGAKSDEAIIKEDHSRMQRAVTEGVCQSSSKFLAAGINTRYIYRSAKSKKELFVFDITEAKCPKQQ